MSNFSAIISKKALEIEFQLIAKLGKLQGIDAYKLDDQYSSHTNNLTTGLFRLQERLQLFFQFDSVSRKGINSGM